MHLVGHILEYSPREHYVLILRNHISSIQTHLFGTVVRGQFDSPATLIIDLLFITQWVLIMYCTETEIFITTES
jgi:hypothetical protein